MNLGYGKKEMKPMALARYEDGLNTDLRTSEVAKKYKARYPRFQCVDCNNIKLSSLEGRSAVKAINSSVSGRIYGSHFYVRTDGSEIKLLAVGQKLYSQNTTSGALTELFDFGGTGEVWFANWLDKCWVTNGTKVIKVESATVAYQVGIDAPTGASAAAAAGGSLPDGDYDVYISYARKVSGTNVLYSKGQSLGTVTLGSGNNTISITCANSSDSQVNNKVVWVDDNGSSVFPFYYETGDNTTTAISISDKTAENTSLLYSVLAAGNDVPGAFEQTHVHFKRLWGYIANVAYYSLQEGNVYDLERFGSTQTITYPFEITGMFTLGEHLYFNTTEGLIRQPYGDPFSGYVRVGSNQVSPLYFKYFRTVASFGNLVMGFTPKTFGIFDGERWLSNDLTRDIKPEVVKMNSGFSADNRPCATIRRASDRVEYIVSYRDTTVSKNINNQSLVLNLDEMKIFDKEDFIAPWEKWDIAANYWAVDSGDNIYGSQSNDTTSVVFKERSDRYYDENVYKGDDITSEAPEKKVRSGTFIPALDGIATFEQIRTLSKFSLPYTVRIQVVSRVSVTGSSTVSPTVSGVPRFGIARFGVDRFAPDIEEPIRTKIKPIKGYAFYVEIKQTVEDSTFQLLELELLGFITKGRMI